MARILVIDDDQSLLQMMSLMLKRAGHTPILASSGQEGISIARREAPEAAIVDVMMPELSGYEVCRILREDPRTADIPLLILTALSQREHRDQATESGADDFVTKPVTRDDLVEHVEELLRTGAVTEPAPVREEEPEEPQVEEAATDRPDFSQTEEKDVSFLQEPTAPMPAATRGAVISGLPVVAVLGLGSGVGSTTLAVNLGLGLMQFGRSAIVDLHPNGGEVAVQFRMIPPRATWVELVEDHTRS